MNILIYGAGAVGLGLASCLIKAGASLHILARPETASQLQQDGLHRTGIFGDFFASPDTFTTHSALNDIPQNTPFDFILVCVKSFDTPCVANDLAARPDLIQPPAKLVLCQNGWGNREIVKQKLPDAAVYSARVITGFKRPVLNHVEITVHAQDVTVGTLGDEPLDAVEPLCAMIANGGLPCSATPHIGRDLWAKMLYNCALNPLGALFDVPYGVLGEWGWSREIMNDAMEEVFAVMTAAGFDTHWKTAADYQRDFYDKLLPPTALHHSSTLQDLRAGKRTEIDALNGAVVRLAANHNLSVPINGTLYRMVKFQEARTLKMLGNFPTR